MLVKAVCPIVYARPAGGSAKFKRPVARLGELEVSLTLCIHRAFSQTKGVLKEGTRAARTSTYLCAYDVNGGQLNCDIE
jgi:hypothetical protein